MPINLLKLSQERRISVLATLAALLLILDVLPYPIANAQSIAAPSTDVSVPMNDFGLRLLRMLTDGRGTNVIVSPLSVSLALAMLYNGAVGETKIAIAKTLSASSLADESFNQNNGVLLKTIEQSDPAVEMEIANALWAQSGFPIKPNFLEVNREYYDAGVESLDFTANPEKALDTINAWVNDKTHTKIPKIFDHLLTFEY